MLVGQSIWNFLFVCLFVCFFTFQKIGSVGQWEMEEKIMVWPHGLPSAEDCRILIPPRDALVKCMCLALQNFQPAGQLCLLRQGTLLHIVSHHLGI